MHFGYSLYADHKEEHVIVKKENSNRTYYDEVNSDKTSLLSRTILVPRVLVSNYIYIVLTRFLVSAMLIVLGVRDDQARRFSKCVKR
jgi:hypothetical protein